MDPITRKEQYLNAIAGGDNDVPETPQTREEWFLNQILENGGGGDPETIKEAVEEWLDEHIDPTTGYAVDDTLSIAGAAADAKAAGDELADVKSAISDIQTATSNDVNKALSPKTVTNGKVTEWQYKVIGGGSGGAVDDVQINGTSIVDGSGVANIPMAGDDFGVVKISSSFGVGISTGGQPLIVKADATNIRLANSDYRPIVPSNQHQAAFYGLAKAAGDSTQSASSTVGTYTESAKSAIQTMLSAPETVSGTTPTIAAKAGVQYICGEVSTLDITTPATGIVDVIFESGSTPAVLTVTPPTGMTMKWANGFDPTALEANTVYELNIMNGVYGVVASWS